MCGARNVNVSYMSTLECSMNFMHELNAYLMNNNLLVIIRGDILKVYARVKHATAT